MTLSDDDSTTEDIPGPSCSESLRRPQFENQRIVDVEAEISLLLAPLNFEERRKFKVTKEDALQLDQIHQQVFAIISGQRELVPQRYRRLKDAFDHSKCVREQIYILRGDASVVEDRECTTTYLNRLSNALNSIVDASFDEEYRKSAILLGLVDGLAEVLILEVQVFKVNLKSNEHRSIRKSIANGLTNLTFKQPLSKQRLCLYNRFIDTVVLIIENAPNLVQVYASIIRNLSWKAEDELAGARLSSCVPALAMALVRAHSQSDKLCVQATLCALWNLASHSNNNKATICNTPHCLQVLAMLLDCDPAKASSVESASGILKYVTQYLSTTSTHLDVRPELVRRLLDLLFDGSFTTITNALGALTNLVVKDPHLQNLIRHNARAMQQLNSLRNCARDDIRGAVKNILNHINQPSSTRYGGMSYSYMDQNSMSMQSSTDRFNYPPMNPSQTISPRLLPLRMNRPSPGASGIPMIQPFEGRSASLPRYLHNTQRQNESHLSPGGGFNMGPRHQQQNQELQNKDPEQDHPDIDLNEASESILCTRGGSTSSINNLSEQPSGGWCSTAETERSSARLSPVSLSELPSSPTLCGVMNQPQLPLSQIDPTGTEMGKNQNEAGGSTASTALVADQVTPTVGQVGPGRISDMHPGYQPMIIPMISQDVQNQSYHGPNVIDSPDDNLPAPSMGDDFYATLQMDVDLLTRSIESALPTSNFNSPGGQHHSRRRYQRSDEVNTSSRRHSGSRRSGGAIQTDNERLLREAILSEMPQQNGQQIMTPKGSKNAWGDFCETEKSSKRRDAVGRPEKNAFDDGPFNDNDMSSDSSISSTVDLSIPTDCNGDDLIVDCKLAMKRKTKPPASHLPLPANHAKTTLRITRSPAARKFQMNQNNSSSNKIAATVSPYNYEKSALNNRPQNSIQATTTSNTSNTNSTKNTSSTIQSNPKQIMIWWVLFLPIIFCSALDQDPVNQLCSPKFFPPNSSTPLSLQQSLNLPNSYFVSGVLTDWITSKIALIEEEVWDLGASSIVKISNKSLDLTWIKDGEDTYFINKTDNTCAYNKTLQVPYGISDRVLKMFNSTGQTLASIVKSVIDFSNSTTGYYITEKQPPVVAGMEGIHWLACKNGSKPEDPALLVEVLFSGDQIEPPTLNISKQIMLSLRIGEFNGSFTENNTSPYSYIHIEFDKLALAEPKETQIKVSGFKCLNLLGFVKFSFHPVKSAQD
ncbi:hypothetical protein WR25_07353 isoform B [Diploscapter pachys]|uniref:LolA-like domain-containing protein n=1 Tax=Diploscapter pachys TaxID=2018661 RepID=A0A2A2KAW2_9BILA|nr:hypothetical protein WR25_07353 isoform B [Diploscapter pachys]